MVEKITIPYFFQVEYIFGKFRALFNLNSVDCLLVCISTPLCVF